MKQNSMSRLQRWSDLRYRDLVDVQTIPPSQGNIFAIRMFNGRSDDYQNELGNIQTSTRHWWFRESDIAPVEFTLETSES